MKPSPKTSCFFIALISAALFSLPGCQTFPDVSVEKNGKRYGLTRGLFQGQWWHHYERALSYADGAFWKEAELDLKEAIRQRDRDQWLARTYGMLNLVDYFPHRELGIIYYKQGQMDAAVRELSNSLNSEKSAKAEHYLDQAQKALIEKKQSDQAPPDIRLHSPTQPFLTRAFSVIIRGIARDDTFVRHVSVGGDAVRVDVSEPEIPFRVKVPLIPGENRIPVQAEDLTGKISQTFISVHVDRRGPVISLDEPFEDPSSPESAVMVTGYASDISGLTELEINSIKIPLPGAKEFRIRQRIPIESGQKELIVKVRDRAGNITIAALTLGGVPKLHFGNVRVLPKYNFGTPMLLARNNVAEMSDMAETLIPVRSGSGITDTISPRIKFRDMKDEQITCLSQIFIDGYVSDGESGVNLFHVNGEPFFESRNRHPGKKHFFGETMGLREGENLISFECIDFAGNAAIKTIRIIRRIPGIQTLASRLQVWGTSFRRVNKNENLSYGFEDHLIKAMRERKRFRIPLNWNMRGLSDEAGALRHAKINEVDALLCGTVNERESEQSVEARAWIRDTETGKILASVDVYGENVDVAKLRKLSQGMEMKLTNELPIAEGMVKKIDPDIREIGIDIGGETNIKEEMELIVYEIGEPGKNPMIAQDFRELGRARVKFIRWEESLAILDQKTDERLIKPAHKVITR